MKSTTQADNKPSREEEKQNYSAPDSLPQEAPASIDDSKVISEPLDSKRGPHGPYNPMDAAMVEVLECDMRLIPCGMKIFGTNNGLVPLDYLTHVFRQLMTGNKDYESLLPGKFALQMV